MNAEPAAPPPVLKTWGAEPRTGPDPTAVVVDETHEWTEAELEKNLQAILDAEVKAARMRYRTYRRKTRFWRSAFRGLAVVDQRVNMKHYAATRRGLVADARKVYGFVDFHLGGVEDVARISQALGMKRGRVLLVLKLVKRGETR